MEKKLSNHNGFHSNGKVVVVQKYCIVFVFTWTDFNLNSLGHWELISDLSPSASRWSSDLLTSRLMLSFSSFSSMFSPPWSLLRISSFSLIISSFSMISDSRIFILSLTSLLTPSSTSAMILIVSGLWIVSCSWWSSSIKLPESDWSEQLVW